MFPLHEHLHQDDGPQQYLQGLLFEQFIDQMGEDVRLGEDAVDAVGELSQFDEGLVGFQFYHAEGVVD